MTVALGIESGAGVVVAAIVVVSTIVEKAVAVELDDVVTLAPISVVSGDEFALRLVVSGGGVAVAVAVAVDVSVGVGVGVHETTMTPVLELLGASVPKRTMMASPSETASTAFSFAGFAQPPKSLQEALPATDAAPPENIGQALR